MNVRVISREEFEDVVKRGNNRAPYGENQRLLKKAEKEAMVLEFGDEKKAISKQTALYVVRRKMVAQVRIVRKKGNLFIGPGEYMPLERAKH